MSKTKHILTKVFYPITIIATDIEVRIRLLKDYPSRLKCYFDKLFGDEESHPRKIIDEEKARRKRSPRGKEATTKAKQKKWNQLANAA